jgi:hypothetical protein
MIETKPPPEVERQFEWLTSAIQRVGNEAPMRVATHLRAVTNGRHFLLPNYHADPLISHEDKSALYKLVFNALVAQKGKPDWSKLAGQSGNGSKRVDPIDVQLTPPVASRPASPLVEDDEPVEQPAVRPPAARPVPTLGNSNGDNERELADALARVLGGRVKGAVDADAVEAIADKCARSVVSEALLNADREFGEKLQQHLGNGSFPTERIQQLIEAALANSARRVVLVKPTGETKPITGLVHKQFDIILKMTSSRVASGHPVPVWLDGPPGGGKSHIMEQLAEALELEPHILAIGPSDTKSAIVGSVATGNFRPGIAYKPYKDGGVLGIDEIAAGDPGVLVSLNSLVANQAYRFPNGELVRKHPNLHVIAADNTRGHGNVKGMIRNRLDAATLDRFAFLRVDYDERLEAALCGNAAWAAYVKRVRDYIAANSSESVYITPRASINGAALLAGGLDPAIVADSTVFKFCSADLKNTILSHIGKFIP